MDTLAHGLWSFAVFHNKKYVFMATLFGVLPDILSFGILILMNIISRNFNFHRGPPPLSSLPGWLFSAYSMTHSFVVFLLVFIAVFIITKHWYWPMMAWAMHILIDIPTHSTRFFPTPFLWPLSSYVFNGISWATPWFMLLNYASLIAVFVLIYLKRA